eukprot:5715196-Prymnesium_polylepis.1
MSSAATPGMVTSPVTTRSRSSSTRSSGSGSEAKPMSKSVSCVSGVTVPNTGFHTLPRRRKWRAACTVAAAVGGGASRRSGV